MKRLVKIALSFTALATFGNARADEVKSTVAIEAAVAATCNLDAFSGPINLSPQIDEDGKTGTAGFVTPVEITAQKIVCTTAPGWTKLSMASSNGGLYVPGKTLTYDVNGTFGKNSTPSDITITTFNSQSGPFTDLLAGDGKSPEGTAELTVLLSAAQTAIAGNYEDTLTITIKTGI